MHEISYTYKTLILLHVDTKCTIILYLIISKALRSLMQALPQVTCCLQCQQGSGLHSPSNPSPKGGCQDRRDTPTNTQLQNPRRCPLTTGGLRLPPNDYRTMPYLPAAVGKQVCLNHMEGFMFPRSRAFSTPTKHNRVQ